MTTFKSITGDDGKKEIPFEDIDYFMAEHQQNQNGLIIKAVIRKELCSQPKTIGLTTYYDQWTEKKYPYNASYQILGKYNKCRARLISLVKKKGVPKTASSMVQTGQNTGFAVHHNYIILDANEVE